MLYAYQLHISVIRSVAEIPGAIGKSVRAYGVIIVRIRTHLGLVPDSQALLKTVAVPKALGAECRYNAHEQ